MILKNNELNSVFPPPKNKASYERIHGDLRACPNFHDCAKLRKFSFERGKKRRRCRSILPKLVLVAQRARAKKAF